MVQPWKAHIDDNPLTSGSLPSEKTHGARWAGRMVLFLGAFACYFLMVSVRPSLPSNNYAPQKHQVQNFRQGSNVTDFVHVEKVSAEFLRSEAHIQEEVAATAEVPEKPAIAYNDTDAKTTRRGAIVLGMHRSGTSMLTGLLVKAGGYNAGARLMRGSAENPKGYFERMDVVLQNNKFMREQGVWWNNNVNNYDPDRALQATINGKVSFQHGNAGLSFFNNPNTPSPWIQKDPRMCITLKTWLELMKGHEPAIIFTYRDPLEVAKSLKRRDKNFSLDKGMGLWINYNMNAIKNSRGLCMVTSSNTATLANPREEAQRVADELTSKCELPAAPSKITQEVADTFVNSTLQHHTAQDDRPVVATYGDCVVHKLVSDTPPDSPLAQREQFMYVMAMKIFCDFESGAAYKEDYVWPSLK